MSRPLWLCATSSPELFDDSAEHLPGLAVDLQRRVPVECRRAQVDDRDGAKKTLTPELINAIASQAHKFNVPVAVHNVTLANAKVLMRAGVEGWLHVPVRQGEIADAEILGIVKDRIARSNRPLMWMTPSLITTWMNTQGGATRPVWLDDPLLTSAYSRLPNSRSIDCRNFCPNEDDPW